jgi:RimJ/RimL family protein N-acetyltransferase
MLRRSEFPVTSAPSNPAASPTPAGKPVRESLAGYGLRIRRYRTDDAERLYESARASIADVHPWLPWCHPNYPLDEARQWIAKQEQAWDARKEFSFLVEDALGVGKLLGGVGLNQFDWTHCRANLGYWVRSGATGRDIATTATKLCAEFGMQDLGLQRVEILVAAGNAGSLRVAEKVRAKREGVLRKRLRIHGVFHDAVMFSLTTA